MNVRVLVNVKSPAAIVNAVVVKVRDSVTVLPVLFVIVAVPLLMVAAVIPVNVYPAFAVRVIVAVYVCPP